MDPHETRTAGPHPLTDCHVHTLDGPVAAYTWSLAEAAAQLVAAGREDRTADLLAAVALPWDWTAA